MADSIALPRLRSRRRKPKRPSPTEVYAMVWCMMTIFVWAYWLADFMAEGPEPLDLIVVVCAPLWWMIWRQHWPIVLNYLKRDED